MKEKHFECIINLEWVNPVRKAETKEQFINELIEEYNEKCFGLFEINRSMIRDIKEI